ncbi:hypothetical protein ASG87_00925 [Frateuria sp. Soil773]|uniref:nuclear transport factor 2 family protein n=1 Tax=Frateuria sp. Soil773 TaxID=1736407 RepID=UPI0006F25DEA|nr:nuclear transport factor 2 family protein [Frateuria sp. Soil773]KRE92507.1 hypothetical protein ASG87_00925 [Frateuria sp. Soil773]
MKPGLPLAVLLFATGLAHARDAAQDRRELLRAEAVLCHAFEVGDAATLGKGLTRDFTLTDSRGQVTDRAQNLDEVAKREPSYEMFRNHGQQVRLYGDAAIITGITSIKGHAGGAAFTGDFQYTDTWVRRDGHWVLAASHASRLAK